MKKFTIKNMFKHFALITNHRFKVFILCIKAGIPWRGFIHDLSKYNPVEFFECVKYFNGNRSPINICKEDIGYSKAWLHHKGRNKHHHEYWYDYAAPEATPIMPYKYIVEKVCDDLAAGQIYQKKNWTKEYQLSYFNKHKDSYLMNDKMKEFLIDIYTQVAVQGINVINKKKLKETYKKHIKNDNCNR